MKRSELKQLIKEELSKQLTEMRSPEVELDDAAFDLAQAMAKLSDLISILDGKGIMKFAQIERGVLDQVRGTFRGHESERELERVVAELLGHLF